MISYTINLGLHPSIANWNWQKEIVWWQLLTKTIHVYFSGYNGTWKICCVVYYYWMNTFSRKLYDDFRPFCRIKTIHFRVSNHFLTFCGFVLLSGMVIAFLRVLKFCNVQYFAIPSDIHIYNVVGMPYTKFWEVLLPGSIETYPHIAVKSIIDMIIHNTFQHLHFMSFLLLCKNMTTHFQRIKLQTISSVMVTVHMHSFSDSLNVIFISWIFCITI